MDNILIVDKVTKEYPGRVAVSDVSFQVKKGSIHGFLGPNGAGKSTTMRMIAGLMPASSGKITLFGEEIHPDKLELKNKIGLLPENPPLYVEMKVVDYLKYVVKLHRLPNASAQVTRILEELTLTDVRDRLIGNLSKGYRQRVGLAQAIVYNAPFLILDEPTNGLDPQSVVELREVIKKLAIEKTILFSSHILSEVEQLCDHVTIIHQGKVRASGDLHQIRQKFHQGLVVKLGIPSHQKLPDLTNFGKHTISQQHLLGTELQYNISFEDDKDLRGDLGRFIYQQGVDLLTLQVESPELEDIFLHMTENKK